MVVGKLVTLNVNLFYLPTLHFPSVGVNQAFWVELPVPEVVPTLTSCYTSNPLVPAVSPLPNSSVPLTV